MEFAAVILVTFNFLYIGATPAFFFRKDGNFNLMWFITGLPLFVWPIPLYGVYWGYLTPLLDMQGDLYHALATAGIVLACGSIALMSLTLGTHRIPLALWHQNNDAPRTIVTWGAYRFIRHPFYTSFILAHIALLLLVPHPFQIVLLAYQILILNGTAAREEKRLAESEFGAEYVEFIANTGRFFPKFNADKFFTRFLVWVTEYRHIVLGLLIVITILFSALMLKLGINATPYFISADHPVRVTESEVKSIFTNTEEQAFVALIDTENGVFTQANLQIVRELTDKLERISFADSDDLETLESIAATDSHASEIVSQIAKDGVNLQDVDSLGQLLAYGTEARLFSPRQLAAINEILVRAHPVKRVRSLFTVEDIKVKGDELDIEPLIDSIPATAAELTTLRQHIMENPLLVGVIVSADGKATNLQVELNISEEDAPGMQAMYKAVAQLLDGVDTQAQLHFSGPPMVTAQIAEVIQTDNMKFFPLVTLVIGIILFLSFRRIQGVVLPMVISSLSTIWTLGFMAIFGVDINIVTASLPVFLMTIAVADSIHYLTDYYKQLETHDPVASVKRSLQHLISPLLMTSVTTCFGFLALSNTKLVFIQQFGLFVAAGVVFAFIITVTLLPAVLPLLKQPVGATMKNNNRLLTSIDRLFSGLYLRTRQHPLPVIVFTLLIIGSCGYVARDLTVDNHNIVQFEPDSRIRQDDALLNQYFGGTVPINVWFSSSDARRFTQPDVIRAMEHISQRFSQHDIIGYVGSPSNLVKRIHQLLNDAPYTLPDEMSAELIAQYYLLYENGSGQEIRDSLDQNYMNARMIALSHTDQSSKVREVVTDVAQYAATVLPADVQIHFSGFGQIMVTSTDEIVHGQISSLIIATLLITGVMILLFRSIIVALLGIVPLAMTILINFATMEWLGINIDIATALIAGIVFGIGVDYAIHFLASLKRAIADGESLEQALVSTVSSVSRPIVVNSISLALGFCALVASSYASTGRLGLLIAATMVVCALLTLVILPVLVKFIKPAALSR